MFSYEWINELFILQRIKLESGEVYGFSNGIQRVYEDAGSNNPDLLISTKIHEFPTFIPITSILQDKKLRKSFFF